MADLQDTIRLGADASGVEAGVTSAKRSLSSLGQAASDAGRKGGSGLDAIGKGGDAAARKVESATKNTIGSIQRQIAAFEAGGKSSREYQESLARMRGIDTNALKPYLDQLDAARLKAGQAAVAQSQFGSSLDKVGLSAAQVGARIGLAITAMVAGTGAAIKSAINTADEFVKMAQKTGVAVEALRELNYAASLSDVSTDALGTGLKKLSQNMALAADGSKEQAAAFAAIGVNVKQLDGTLKGADTVVSEIAGKFAGLKDSSEKTAIAVALFGKAGADMIPLLNSGSAGLREMGDEARALGQVFSADLAKNAEAFNDNLTRITASAQGGAYAILNELLPTLNLLTDKFFEASRAGTGFAGFLGAAFKKIIETVTIVASDLVFVVESIGRELGAVGAQLVALATLDIKGFNAISEAVKADGVRARAELDKFQYDVLNAGILTSKAGAGRGTAKDPRILGDTLGTAAIINTRGGSGDSAAKKAISDANRELAEQAKLLAELAGLTGSFAEDWDRLSAVYKAGKLDLEGLTKAQADLLAKQPAIKAMHDAEVKAADAIAKANQSARDERAKYINTLSQGLDKVYADVAAQQEQNERLGLSKQAIVALDAAKLDLMATEIERQAVRDLDVTLDERQYDLAVKQAQAYRDLAKAKVEGAAKAAAIDQAADAAKIAADAAKKAEEAWQKTADSINESLTDALLRGFEAGKDFAANFRDTLVNMFETLVLRPVISAAVTPVAQAVTGSLGLAGAANAATSGAGLLSGASSLFGSFGSGVSSGFSAWGAGGSVTGLLGSGSSIFAGGIANGLGVLAGALGPIALGIGVLSSLFGGEKNKQQNTGNATSYFSASGALTRQDTFFGGSSANTDKIINGLQDAYAKAAASLSIGTVATAFNFGSNVRKDGTDARFALGGYAGSSAFQQTETASSESAIQLAASRAVFAALQGSDLPSYLSGAFDGLVAGNLDQAGIDAALAGAQALKVLHTNLLALPLEILRDLSFEATQNLIAFSGGIDQLGANLATYYDQFYAAEEKRQTSVGNIVARLNSAGGNVSAADFASGGSLDTRAEYRALVEATDPSSALYANLLAMAGAFAALTPDTAALAAAAQQAADRLAGINAGLQDKLDLLTGAQTERSLELRDATDESTKALLRQIYAQQDLATAASAATQAAEAAAAAYQQSQRDRLSGATDAASAAYDDLARSIDAQRAADTAAYEAQKAIAKAAFTSQSELLQGQIDGARNSLDSVGESVRKLGSLSQTLRTTLSGLRISGGEGQTRANAQAQISAALASARGGSLPLDGQLSGALHAISQPSEQLFSSFADYARDFYKTANDISALGNISDAQLSEAEATQAILKAQVESLTEQKSILRDGFDDQVSALDGILENARLQLDAANGINTSVLSVAAALEAFSGAKSNLEAARASQVLPTTAGVAEDRNSKILGYVKSVLADPSLDGAGQAQAIAATAKQYGVTEAELASATGFTAAQLREYFAYNNIPRFAVGTNYVSRDGPAYLHEGEAVVPKAYNPAAGGAGAIEALVATLTAEIRTLRASTDRAAENTGRMANTLDGQQSTPLLVEIAA